MVCWGNEASNCKFTALRFLLFLTDIILSKQDASISHVRTKIVFLAIYYKDHVHKVMVEYQSSMIVINVDMQK